MWPFQSRSVLDAFELGMQGFDILDAINQPWQATIREIDSEACMVFGQWTCNKGIASC